ncbi:MAG: Na+/H+ antiporter subunit E [Thermoanaerobaculia bacterium]
MRRRSWGGVVLRWFRRASLGLQLLGRFVVELLLANLQQAGLVLRWPLRVRPRWIRFETRLRSETARTLLGALISLTPGTLTCDLQGPTLLIHALNATSDEAVRARIRQRFESLLVQMEET